MLVAFLVAGMILPVIPGGGEKMVYAETMSPNPNNWATPLATSTGGKQLTQGFYYVEPNTTVSCTNSNWGGNGITIANNATVYIYIPEGSTLVATGTKGNSRTNGGGAGVWYFLRYFNIRCRYIYGYFAWCTDWNSNSSVSGRSSTGTSCEGS